MDKQLNLKNIALIGRTFQEYHNMFDLHDALRQNEIILDVASGVSSFCAEANGQGFNVTASDRIYSLSPYEIEQKCIQDLDIIIKQLPDIADLFVWNFFKDIQALESNRKKHINYSSKISEPEGQEDMCQSNILPQISVITSSQFPLSPIYCFCTKTNWIMISIRRRFQNFSE